MYLACMEKESASIETTQINVQSHFKTHWTQIPAIGTSLRHSAVEDEERTQIRPLLLFTRVIYYLIQSHLPYQIFFLCQPLTLLNIHYQADVDGGWSAWGAYGHCEGTSCKGLQHRTRTCTSPKPSGDGSYCTGSSFEARQCELSDSCGNQLQCEFVTVLEFENIIHASIRVSKSSF